MKRIILFAICLGLLSCSKIDNYKEPDARIVGKLIDATTKEVIPSQGLNGARIQLYEVYKGVKATTVSNNVWVEVDGTFRNERVFSGSYHIVPVGPFLAADTLKTSLPASGAIDLEVEPHLRINLDETTLDGTTLNTKFTVTRSDKSTGAFAQYVVLYSASDNFGIDGYIKRALYNTTDASIGVQKNITIEGVDLTKPVFVRVAAKSAASSYWNYSVVKRLK